MCNYADISLHLKFLSSNGSMYGKFEYLIVDNTSKSIVEDMVLV